MSYRTDKIRFFNNGIKFSLSNRTQFKSFLQKMIAKEGRVPETINYIFCDDEELKRLNKQYLNHNYYTDILTFDLSVSNKKLTAEIFISVPRVKENSKNLNQSFTKELHRVMIHGILHLCGYKDKTQLQEKAMRKAEDTYLYMYKKSFHVKRT